MMRWLVAALLGAGAVLAALYAAGMVVTEPDMGSWRPFIVHGILLPQHRQQSSSKDGGAPSSTSWHGAGAAAAALLLAAAGVGALLLLLRDGPRERVAGENSGNGEGGGNIVAVAISRLVQGSRGLVRNGILRATDPAELHNQAMQHARAHNQLIVARRALVDAVVSQHGSDGRSHVPVQTTECVNLCGVVMSATEHRSHVQDDGSHVHGQLLSSVELQVQHAVPIVLYAFRVLYEQDIRATVHDLLTRHSHATTHPLSTHEGNGPDNAILEHNAASSEILGGQLLAVEHLGLISPCATQKHAESKGNIQPASSERRHEERDCRHAFATVRVPLGTCTSFAVLIVPLADPQQHSFAADSDAGDDDAIEKDFEPDIHAHMQQHAPTVSRVEQFAGPEHLSFRISSFVMTKTTARPTQKQQSKEARDSIAAGSGRKPISFTMRPLARTFDSTRDGGACLICWDSPACVAFRPCKHVCVCTTCAQSLSRCPTCAAPIWAHTLLGTAASSNSGSS